MGIGKQRQIDKRDFSTPFDAQHKIKSNGWKILKGISCTSEIYKYSYVSIAAEIRSVHTQTVRDDGRVFNRVS